MKILLINNHTRHLPGLDFSCADKDLVILSGGGTLKLTNLLHAV